MNWFFVLVKFWQIIGIYPVLWTKSKKNHHRLIFSSSLLHWCFISRMFYAFFPLITLDKYHYFRIPIFVLLTSAASYYASVVRSHTAFMNCGQTIKFFNKLYLLNKETPVVIYRIFNSSMVIYTAIAVYTIFLSIMGFLCIPNRFIGAVDLFLNANYFAIMFSEQFFIRGSCVTLTNAARSAYQTRKHLIDFSEKIFSVSEQ